jgi:hypothetical protein
MVVHVTVSSAVRYGGGGGGGTIPPKKCYYGILPYHDNWNVLKTGINPPL